MTATDPGDRIAAILADDSGVPQEAMLTVAMNMLRGRIKATSDPVEAAGYVVALGEYVLERLGFTMTERAHVQIDIGTDDEPDEARITLTWPMPPDPDAASAAALAREAARDDCISEGE